MCGEQYDGPHDGATGCDSGYGKTTAEMHQQSTFQDSLAESRRIMEAYKKITIILS